MSVCRKELVPTTNKPIRQKPNCVYSVKNTINTCVPRYFKVGISFSVQREYMCCVTCLQYIIGMTDRLTT